MGRGVQMNKGFRKDKQHNVLTTTQNCSTMNQEGTGEANCCRVEKSNFFLKKIAEPDEKDQGVKGRH